MNLPPWLVLASLLSLVAALLYQLVTRRLGWRILPYWLLALAGLLLSEAAAESLGLDVTRFGDLRLLPDAIGAGGTVALLWFLKL